MTSDRAVVIRAALVLAAVAAGLVVAWRAVERVSDLEMRRR